MDVRITVDTAADEDLRDLREWLDEDLELRGWIEPVEAPPPPLPGSTRPARPATNGHHPHEIEALIAVLGPAGVADALISGLVSWLREHPADPTIRIERSDGTVLHVDGTRIRRFVGADLHAEVERLSDLLYPVELHDPDDYPEWDGQR